MASMPDDHRSHRQRRTSLLRGTEEPAMMADRMGQGRRKANRIGRPRQDHRILALETCRTFPYRHGMA